jgi:hypothetical protein
MCIQRSFPRVLWAHNMAKLDACTGLLNQPLFAVNTVFNCCSELSVKVFERERGSMKSLKFAGRMPAARRATMMQFLQSHAMLQVKHCGAFCVKKHQEACAIEYSGEWSHTRNVRTEIPDSHRR